MYIMGKTILFCADGTWNGPRNAHEEDGDAVEEGRTDVYKLFANLHAQTPADDTAKEQERDLVDATGRPTGIAKYLHGVGDSGNLVVRVLGGTVGAGLVARIVRGGWWSYIAAGAVNFVLDVQATLTRAPHNNLPVDRIRAVGVGDTVGALGAPIIRNDTLIDVFGFADTTLSPKVVNGA